MSNTERPALLKSAEVCRQLRISRNTLLAWVKSGRLPAYRFGTSSSYLFKQSDLDGLLKKVERDGTE